MDPSHVLLYRQVMCNMNKCITPFRNLEPKPIRLALVLSISNSSLHKIWEQAATRWIEVCTM